MKRPISLTLFENEAKDLYASLGHLRALWETTTYPSAETKVKMYKRIEIIRRRIVVAIEKAHIKKQKHAEREAARKQIVNEKPLINTSLPPRFILRSSRFTGK